MSPVPGRSTLITSAPNQASSCVQVGPDWTCVKSRIFTPSSALPSWPQGFFDIFILGASFSSGFFTAFSLAFTTFLAAFFAFLSSFLALAFTAFLDFFAMVVPLLLLLQLALRIEIADAARLAAGGRIDRGVDQRGLAG